MKKAESVPTDEASNSERTLAAAALTEEHPVGLPIPNVASPQADAIVPEISPPLQVMQPPAFGLRRTGSCVNARWLVTKRHRRHLFPELVEIGVNIAPNVFSTPTINMISGATNNAGPSQRDTSVANSAQMGTEDNARNTTNATTSCTFNTNVQKLILDLERQNIELQVQPLETLLEHDKNKNVPPGSMQPSPATKENYLTPKAYQVMESLRKTAATTASATNHIIDDGETPSTSQAAAAKRSQSKPEINNDSVIMESSQPVPKKPRTKRKLTSVENDKPIRKSKRGQVPIKHNWSCQQSDQSVSYFEFLFDEQVKRSREQTRKRQEMLETRMRLAMQNSQSICTSAPNSKDTTEHLDPATTSMDTTEHLEPPTTSMDTTEHLEPPNIETSATKPLCYGAQSIDMSSPVTSVDPISMHIRVISEIPAAAAAVAPASSNLPQAVGATYENKDTNTMKRKYNQNKAIEKDNANQRDNTNKEAPAALVKELNSMINTLRAASYCEKQQQQPATERQQPEEEGIVACVGNATSTCVESERKLPTRQSTEFHNEVVAWLKGDTGSQGMTLALRDNLVFSVMEGIEYAFYKTDNHFSLMGYMRFKPLQSRPFKHAPINLHFIIISGEFAIGRCSLDSKRIEQSTVCQGNAVEISEGSLYSLQNLLLDISILMVIN